MPNFNKATLQKIARQFLKFFVVGVINTAIDFLVLNIEIRITGITSGPGLFIMNALSFSVATINSYFMNKLWTFQSKENSNQAVQFSQFLSVSLVGVLINSSIVYLVTTFTAPFLGIPTLMAMIGRNNPEVLWANLAKVMATGVSLIWNFIGYKLWVFKK